MEGMTPEDVLSRAKGLLLSAEFEPVIAQALGNAKDVAVAAATLVYPIVFRLLQESDLPEDEMFGNEDGDGIAIYLLQEVFDIAGEAGIPGTDDRNMAVRAVELLGDMLEQSEEGQSQIVRQQMGGPAMSEPAQESQGGLLRGAA